MFYKGIFITGLCLLLPTVTSYSAAETAASKDKSQAGEAQTTKVGGAETEQPKDKQGGSEAPEVIISLGDRKLTMQQVKWMRADADGAQILRLVEWWLENELLYAEAEKRGITNDPKTTFFADIMRKNAFRNELASRVQEAVQITDNDVLAYYEKNKETDPMLMEGGYLAFSHVRTNTLEEAQDALKRIKAGESIEQLAKQLSIYKDARRGGAVRRINYRKAQTDFGARFLEAIRAAKEGDLVGPIKVEGESSYEVALKKEEAKPVPKPFEAVKDRIKPRLERAEKDKAFKELVKSLRKQASDKIVKSAWLTQMEKGGTEEPKENQPPPLGPESKPAEPTSTPEG